MNSDTVDISGLDKVELLHALWRGQVVANFYGGGMSPSFNIDHAKKAVTGYIDYFSGRAMKTNLSGNTAEPRLYNRDAGAGAFERIVSEMRKQQ